MRTTPKFAVSHGKAATLLGLLGISAGTYVGFKIPEGLSPIFLTVRFAASNSPSNA